LGRDDKKAAGSGFLLLAHSRHRPARGPNTPPPVAKTEIDNQQVHVVCRRYAPHENFPIHSYPDGVVANADRIEVAMRWHQMSERTLENRGAPPRDRQVAEVPNSVQNLSFCQLR
jgi:hypothetical protein